MTGYAVSFAVRLSIILHIGNLYKISYRLYVAYKLNMYMAIYFLFNCE